MEAAVRMPVAKPGVPVRVTEANSKRDAEGWYWYEAFIQSGKGKLVKLTISAAPGQVPLKYGIRSGLFGLKAEQVASEYDTKSIATMTRAVTTYRLAEDGAEIVWVYWKGTASRADGPPEPYTVQVDY